MKTIRLLRNLLVGALIVSMSPSYAAAPSVPAVPTVVSEQVDKEKIQRMEARLHEIKAMDLKNLSRSEKRALRKEVKEIEKTMDGGGLYISVGALIIIIILLIILL